LSFVIALKLQYVAGHRGNIVEVIVGDDVQRTESYDYLIYTCIVHLKVMESSLQVCRFLDKNN
jgi:hypothetical protein